MSVQLYEHTGTYPFRIEFRIPSSIPLDFCTKNFGEGGKLPALGKRWFLGVHFGYQNIFFRYEEDAMLTLLHAG